MKKRIIVTLFIIMLFVLTNVKTYANENEEFSFCYIETKHVMENKKVYLNENVAIFLQKSNLEIFDDVETTGAWFWKKTVHHYYYYASCYVDEIVNVINLDNSIDSVIYMIKQLELYAQKYLEESKNGKKINDLVLGYLRCINVDYSDGENIYDSITKYAFKELCKNSYDADFVKYVDTEENYKVSLVDSIITIPYFFSNYTRDEKFNAIYGEKHKFKYDLVDSIENYNIDLPHMFSVTDALRHAYKGVSIPICYQLVSWLGDLHQATFKKNDNNIYDITDFYNDVLCDSLSKFDISDFIADVDGYNVGYSILSNEKNNNLKVSDALNSYYNLMKKDKTLRYKFFIKNVSIEFENPGGDAMVAAGVKAYTNQTQETGVNGFKYSVYTNLGISPLNENDLYRMNPINYANPFYKFLYEDDGKKNDFPEYKLRLNMARSFSDFVLRKADYNE